MNFRKITAHGKSVYINLDNVAYFNESIYTPGYTIVHFNYSRGNDIVSLEIMMPPEEFMKLVDPRPISDKIND